MKRWVKWGITWTVSLGLFFFLFHRIPMHQVWEALSRVDPQALVLAGLVSLFGKVILACEKYRRILELLGCRLSLKETILLKMGSLPLKSVMPMKSGEGLRMVYLKKRHQLSYPKGFVSFLLNYALSVCALSMFLLGGVLLLGSPKIYILPLSLVVLWGIVLFLVLRKITKGMDPPDWIKRINKNVSNGLHGVRERTQGKGLWRVVLVLVIFSVGFETCKLVNYCILLHAFGVPTSLSTVLIKIPVILFISSLPVSVLGMGTREAAIVGLLPTTIEPNRLLGAGLLISFVESILPLILGLVLTKPFLARLIGDDKDGGESSLPERT